MLKELNSTSIKYPKHSKNKTIKEVFIKNLENYKQQEKLAKRINKYPPKQLSVNQILKTIPSNEKKLYSHNFRKEFLKTLGSNSKYAFLTTNDSTKPYITSTGGNSFNYDHNNMLNNITTNIVEPFNQEKQMKKRNSVVLLDTVQGLNNNVKEMNIALENSNKINNDLIINTNKYKCDYLEKKLENENLEKEANSLKSVIEKIKEQIMKLNRETTSMKNIYSNENENINSMKNEINNKKEEIKFLENDNKNNRSILLLFNSKCNDLKIEIQALKDKNNTVGKGLEYITKSINK